MKNIRCTGFALIGALALTIHAQSYKVLVNFNGKPSGPAAPGNIAQSRGGYLLSTSGDQGSDPGLAFRITTSGVLTVLHAFDTTDGANPAGGLTLGKDGRFYGTTEYGGSNGVGTLFQMTPDGIVKTLHEFGEPTDYPVAAPIQSLSGDFYGTASGDNSHLAIAYKIDGSGNYTLLHTFSLSEGEFPYAQLVQATDYWFYGTAWQGGRNDYGTIFRVSSSGEFEDLFDFQQPYGRIPVAGLIQANDGNFYGVTQWGGAHELGVVFRMTPTHQVTVIHDFTGGSDGSHPVVALIQATDGYLYGTTVQGGAFGGGVLFRVSTTGEVTGLHDFQPSTGAIPTALIQHTNGFLYGDTSTGGTYGNGVFYRFDLGLSPFVTYLPSYGRVGMTVDILGEYFTADSEVFFNGVRAQIITVQPTYMRVVVPDGATSGLITVTTTKGALKSNKVFLVRP